MKSSSQLLIGKPDIKESDSAGAYLWRADNRLHFTFKSGELLEACSGKVTASGFKFNEINTSTPVPIPALRENTLYENNNGNFVVKSLSGLAGSGLALVAIPADFNNDGLEDLYQVNIGYSFTKTNPPNQLFLNRGHNVFSEIAKRVGAAGPDSGNGNSAIAFDYDNDGDLDLLLLNGMTNFPGSPGPMILLENEGKVGNSVAVTLQGTLSNRRGWGTQLVAVIGGKRHLLQKYGMNGYLSTSDLPVHIGMGSADHIDRLIVKWPSGKSQMLKHVPAGSRLIVKEE